MTSATLSQKFTVSIQRRRRNQQFVALPAVKAAFVSPRGLAVWLMELTRAMPAHMSATAQQTPGTVHRAFLRAPAGMGLQAPRRRRMRMYLLAGLSVFAGVYSLALMLGVAPTRAPSARVLSLGAGRHEAGVLGAPADIDGGLPATGGASELDLPAGELHGRRLQSTEPECEPAGASLSIVTALAGDEKCDGSCAMCCSGLDSPGGVVFYFFIVIYTFLGLAIICDDYFCESLEAISEALSLSDDVAGATFMAAGSSAPELFTAVVTILITGGSEGLGTIVGSAVFNIMIIVGVTALAAGQRLKIWWFPLARDCIVYVISIIMMAIVVSDKVVNWWEALILTLSYGGYIFLMVKNAAITDWIEAREKKAKEAKTGTGDPAIAGHRRSSMEPMKSATVSASLTDIQATALRLAAAAEQAEREAELKTGNTGGSSPVRTPTSKGGPHTKLPALNVARERLPSDSPDGTGSTRSTGSILPRVGSARVSPERQAAPGGAPTTVASSGSLGGTGGSSNALLLAGAAGGGGGGGSGSSTPPKPSKKEEEKKRGMNPLLKPMNRVTTRGDVAAERKKARDALHKKVLTVMVVHKAKGAFMAKIKAKRAAAAAAAAAAGEAAGELVPETPAPPSGGGLAALMAANASGGSATESKKEPEEEDDGPEGIGDKILWAFSLPYEFAFKFTVPDCRKEHLAKYYMATFTSSIIWIGLLSFIMVDFASRAGCVLQVPGIVMGLIVIAAGTSVPDALSSVLVAKNGQGDMAVANVLGSNVFNIFLGLGLPWLIKSLIEGGEPILLPADEEIIVPTIILLGYVVVFVGFIAGLGWTLNPTLGYIFIGCHALFVVWNLLTMLENPIIQL